MFFDWAYKRVQPILGPFGMATATRFSANQITVVGCVLGVIMNPFIILDSWWALLMAFVLNIIAGVLDLLDGKVARIRRDVLRLADDPVYGGYLDAMCDKVRLIPNSLLLLLVFYTHRTAFYSLPGEIYSGLLFLTFSLVAEDVLLGSIRYEDYQEEKKSRQNNLTTASMNGKNKTACWTVANGGFILALMNNIDHWGLFVGLLFLWSAVLYAAGSIRDKLIARNPAK